MKYIIIINTGAHVPVLNISRVAGTGIGALCVCAVRIFMTCIVVSSTLVRI